MTDNTLKKYAKEAAELTAQIAALNAQLAELETAQKAVKAKIAEEIGVKAEKTVGRYTLKTWTSTRLNADVKRLAAELPEVYEAYKKPSTVSQFLRVTVED